MFRELVFDSGLAMGRTQSRFDPILSPMFPIRNTIATMIDSSVRLGPRRPPFWSSDSAMCILSRRLTGDDFVPRVLNAAGRPACPRNTSWQGPCSFGDSPAYGVQEGDDPGSEIAMWFQKCIGIAGGNYTVREE